MSESSVTHDRSSLFNKLLFRRTYRPHSLIKYQFVILLSYHPKTVPITDRPTQLRQQPPDSSAHRLIDRKSLPTIVNLDGAPRAPSSLARGQLPISRIILFSRLSKTGKNRTGCQKHSVGSLHRRKRRRIPGCAISNNKRSKIEFRSSSLDSTVAKVLPPQPTRAMSCCDECCLARRRGENKIQFNLMMYLRKFGGNFRGYNILFPPCSPSTFQIEKQPFTRGKHSLVGIYFRNRTAMFMTMIDNVILAAPLCSCLEPFRQSILSEIDGRTCVEYNIRLLNSTPSQSSPAGTLQRKIYHVCFLCSFGGDARFFEPISFCANVKRPTRPP